VARSRAPVQRQPARQKLKPGPDFVPAGPSAATVHVDGRNVALTNLNKIFFPKLALTKGDLMRYYARIAPALLPHIAGKAMVMKRYPNGATSDFFFMKRAPSPRPNWIRTCAIEHGSGNVINFPVIDDVSSLLWLINLGCIDLNPWYAPCDDFTRPDYLHIDLDPFDAPFEAVREAALIVRDVFISLGMTPYAKTTGSKGIHVYVSIRRGPSQHGVWEVAKAVSRAIAEAHKDLLIVEYRVARRPRGRVLLDYNQNSFGRTLASVYSVRPNEAAMVSTPLEWEEVERGCEPGDFTMLNVVQRVEEVGDLWAPLERARGRFDLAALAKKLHVEI
jgi:bifunctional non-homologous end joining protein LigD